MIDKVLNNIALCGYEHTYFAPILNQALFDICIGVCGLINMI